MNRKCKGNKTKFHLYHRIRKKIGNQIPMLVKTFLSVLQNYLIYVVLYQLKFKEEGCAELEVNFMLS